MAGIMGARALARAIRNVHIYQARSAMCTTASAVHAVSPPVDNILQRAPSLDAQNDANAAMRHDVAVELRQAERFSFAKRIEQKFENMAWLDQALTHKSAQVPDHNARLAVLGKALARAFAVEALVYRFPNLPGVCCDALAEHVLGTEGLFRFGLKTGVLRGVQKGYVGRNSNGFKDEEYREVIGDAMGAVVGAIYSDRGPADAQRFVTEFMMNGIREETILNIIALDAMPRETLRDLALKNGKPSPEYRILKEIGVQTHKPTIVVGVFVDGEMVGEGTSTNQTLAEHEAARDVLNKHYMLEIETLEYPSTKWGEDASLAAIREDLPKPEPTKRALASNYP